MKKFILLAALLCAAVAASAQYYNPYMTPQNMAIGYQIGQQAAQRAIEQQEQMLRNNPNQMRGAMISAISGNRDETAYEYAQYLAENQGLASDWYWLGVLNEAGIHDYDIEYAKRCYRRGIAAGGDGGNACRARLAALENGNELDAATVRSYCHQITSYSTAATLPSFDSGSSSSYGSSNSRGGVCQRCHGTRIDPVRVDFQPGSSTASNRIPAYTRCPYCGETKTIDHWHERCLNCATY